MARTPAPVTTDADALLAAVWAAPHDDLPRLIYADFLEENGDPDRAEFVRLQIDRAARESVGDDVTDAAWAREHELLARHRAAWLGLVPGVFVAPDLHRGFPAGGRHYSASEAVKLGPNRTPGLVCRLSLGWAKPDGLGPLLAAPVVRQAAQLTLGPARPWSAADFDALSARADCLAHVTHLHLAGAAVADPDRLYRWAASLDLPRLHALSPCGHRPGGDLLVALAASPAAGRLTELDLSGVHLTNAGLAALAGATAFARLRTLRLTSGTMSEAGLVAFLRSPLMPGLRRFDPPSLTRLGDRYYAALAATPAAAGLKVLEIGYRHTPSAATVRRMALSPRLKSLREVHARPANPAAGTLKAGFGPKLRPLDDWHRVRPAMSEV